MTNLKILVIIGACFLLTGCAATCVGVECNQVVVMPFARTDGITQDTTTEEVTNTGTNEVNTVSQPQQQEEEGQSCTSRS